MTAGERELAWFHAGFAAIAAALLAVRLGPAGPRVGLAVLLYLVGLPLVARWRGHPGWIRMWAFGALLSLWQVLPDVFLVRFGVLRFPDDGLFDLGPVTAYMAGLWAIPTVVVVAVGLAVEERRGRGAGAVAAGLVGFLLYLGAEAVAPVVPAWEAEGVTMLGNVALYILPAQVLLSVISFDAYAAIRDRGVMTFVPVTFLVMLLYLGAALFGFLVVEWLPGDAGGHP